MKYAYVNGDIQPTAEAKISVFDSGLNFGDGVFEGMRVYRGAIVFLDEHVERLFGSAKAIDLEIPLAKHELAAELIKWLGHNEIVDNFHFRPIVTRGNRHPPRVDPRFARSTPNILFVGGEILNSFVGISAVVSTHRRPPPDVLDSKIKSLSYLTNCMAKLDAIRHGSDDALVFDTHGYLAEASASNVFLVKASALYTPFTTACLAGITRAALIGLAATLGMEVFERDLTLSDVYNADEIFLCGTGVEITPVTRVEGKPVGSGTIGPVARQLRESYLGCLGAHSTSIV